MRMRPTKPGPSSDVVDKKPNIKDLDTEEIYSKLDIRRVPYT
jgi:hypothetical protein